MVDIGQNQIDLRKIDELKKLLYEVTSMNLNTTEGSSARLSTN